MRLLPQDFDRFFEAVHGVAPFEWQRLLARRVATDGWPRGIDLPTASGKTACLDIAVFSLAISAASELPSPRRSFFVVDRRIVVDEAYERARKLAAALAQPESPIVAEVATRLRKLAGTSDALVVCRMRGGIEREDAWVGSPAQPAIITGTVDQVGSRLLFRGYGPGQLSQSIHAALIGCDSLILLDEAHCAIPFMQTAQAVRAYSGGDWAEEPVAPPLTFVVLSATLPQEVPQEERFPRDDFERKRILSDEALRPRIETPKPAVLKVCDDLVRSAAGETENAIKAGCSRIAVMVNRVSTAAATHLELQRRLSNEEARVLLMTGRMRPVDRDALTETWSPVLKVNPTKEPDPPLVVVTTQCLEVGADFSFDALIVECASLDALRQRFGRLNRLGRPEVPTKAAILVRSENLLAESAAEKKKVKSAKGRRKGQKAENQPVEQDWVYGNALLKTWHWLGASSRDGVIDMSFASSEGRLRGVPREELAQLLAPSPNAATLLPAHLDLLCQTAPQPVPEPDVSVFLHGPERGVPEARLVFRADLSWNAAEDEDGNRRKWLDAVCLMPPVSAEGLSVPLPVLRRWLAGQPTEEDDPTADVEGQRATGEAPQRREEQTGNRFLVWQGRRRSFVSRNPRDVAPGDTVIVPAVPERAVQLRHYFAAPDANDSLVLDVAERAYLATGKRLTLRIVDRVLKRWKEAPPIAALLAWAAGEDREKSALRDLLDAVVRYPADGGESALPEWLRQIVRSLGGRPRVEDHPDEGVVLLEPRRGPETETDEFADDDDGTLLGARPLTLAEHTADVLQYVRDFTGDSRRSLVPQHAGDLRVAATLHDIGKADERFQTFLRGRIPTPSEASRILAKSDGLPRSYSKRRRLRELAELPGNFRHEMLSVQLAERRPDLPVEPDRRDLILHLIASHHGHGRPFAPVCTDHDPPDVSVCVSGAEIAMTGEERKDHDRFPPSHRPDSGVPDRFWKLTRRYGWWGLAYLESVLRLGDWLASRTASHASPTNDREAARSERNR